MGTPLKTRLFNAFLGTDESIHALILPAIFSSGGSSNVYIDKFARVRKIPGYTKKFPTGLIWNTNPEATRISGLFPYRKTIGTPGTGEFVSRVIVAAVQGVNGFGTELWYSTDGGANFTFSLYLGVTSGQYVSDFVQFGDTLYHTDGSTAPLKKTADGQTWAAVQLTQTPTPTAALVASTAGVLNGDYTYKLMSRDNTATRQNGSPTSNPISAALGQISLSWTADANTNIIGYELYRTTGTSTTMYYVGWIEGRTTVAYTDNVSDDTIIGNRVLEEHGDAPTQGVYFMVAHKQRMWWMRYDTAPTIAYYSDVNLPGSVYAYNSIIFQDSDTMGDHITGGIGDFEGKLVIFTERAVWQVTGTGTVVGNIRDWTRTRTNAQVGGVSKRSIVKIPSGAKYPDQNGVIQTTSASSIAYFTPYGDIRLLTHSFIGDGDVIISLPMASTLALFDYTNRKLIHAVHDPDLQQITWFYPVSGGSGQPSKGVTWNYRYGVWYPHTSTPFLSSCVADSSTDATIMLVGQAETSTGGIVYKFYDGLSFDGTAIAAQWETKVLRGVDDQGQEDLSHTSRFRWADVLVDLPGTSPSITVSWLPGSEALDGTVSGSKTLPISGSLLVTSDGVPIATADGDLIYVGAAHSQSKVILEDTTGRFIHDTGIVLKFSESSATSTWAIEGITLAYQTLEGQKRREQ